MLQGDLSISNVRPLTASLLEVAAQQPEGGREITTLFDPRRETEAALSRGEGFEPDASLFEVTGLPPVSNPE